MELQLFIERLANVYFWVCLSFIILSSLQFLLRTEEYEKWKRSQEIKIQRGKYQLSSWSEILFWTSWILSMYYK